MSNWPLSLLMQLFFGASREYFLKHLKDAHLKCDQHHIKSIIERDCGRQLDMFELETLRYDSHL
jgi:hypothetical protein